MGNIQLYHEALHESTLQKIAEKKGKEKNRFTLNDYHFFAVIEKLQDNMYDLLNSEGVEISKEDIMFKIIDRKQYGADIAISSSALMRLGGEKYQKEIAPKIVEYINNKANEENSVFKSAVQVGIYINITLRDIFLMEGIGQIEDFGASYGTTNSHNNKVIIAEYSSPNAAKHLHAGHIRSTVIGQVLANMYKEVGYEVHTCNHVNDRGGFGEIIEGYNRRKNLLENEYKGNDLSFAIYTIYRSAEKLYNAIQEKKDIKDEDLKAMQKYFTFSTNQEFLKAYELYREQAQQTFRNLESGRGEEFMVWKEIYTHSMEEFNQFYHKLGVEHDYTIGESFYEKIGKELVQVGMEKGIIVHFTQEKAEAYFEDYLLGNSDADPKIIKNKKKEIFADVGSYVALLDDFERYVVLRSDGASIYSTRDLGCIYYRSQHWNPSTIMYEVGQEQADHFNKLFETARKFGRDQMDHGKKREYLHISHGFYVNNKTKKKLSSREGASNVMNLIASSEQYFKDKYHQHTDEFDEAEIEHIAQVLGKTSIIINDIRKGRMSPVLVDTNIQKTLEEFEKAGGVYLMYTLCRAKSVLLKSNNIDIEKEIQGLELLQADLIKLMMQYPKIIEKAVEVHEPSMIVEYIYELTSSYNTLYNDKSQGKITENYVNQMITNGFITIIENAFRVFHIDALERM